MIFISIDDFLTKVNKIQRLTREEEALLACRAAKGEEGAKQQLFEGYLPFVASFVKRLPKDIQSLDTVYRLISTLKSSLDDFDFNAGGSFVHYLSRRLRRCSVECIANKA